LVLAARAHGTSTIIEPSQDPDVQAVVAFLRQCGVGIQTRTDGALVVTGRPTLDGATFAVPPDRVEAGTLAIATLLTGGSTILRSVTSAALGAPVVSLLRRCGATVVEEHGCLCVSASSDGTRSAAPQDVATGPYPGYPSDLQPVTTVLLTQVGGVSTVRERVYASRASHVDGLRKFGANIGQTDQKLTVRGPTPLSHATVAGTDIRCAVAYILAALVARGSSTVAGLFHLRRGHGDLVGQLRALGADIEVIGVDDVDGARAGWAEIGATQHRTRS
jgi:UDP-N-acetylglucosamine 1-carboxyvinyltransferase